LLQRGGLVAGQFTWDARRAGMRRVSFMGRWPLIAIPLTAVRITQAGRTPVIADACTAILYNRNTCYVAEQLLDDRPEQTLWIVPDEHTVRDSVRAFDPRSADSDQSPLPFDHAPISAKTFAQIRLLVARLHRDGTDPVEAEESLTELSGELIASSFTARGRPPKREPRTMHREVACAAREFCLNHFTKSLGLNEIAQAAGVSRFHLCRVFRSVHGCSIHEYLTQVRLRASLEGVCDRRASLAGVALSVGFSSQSHFTTAFARYFVRTPAAYRRAI
jgi:AraC-like DNA-binding protein